jgi:hypothetical protein
LKEIELVAVGLTITTPVAVKCGEMESYFTEVSRRTIKPDDFKKVILEISRLTRKSNEYSQMVDSRKELRPRYDSTTKIVCDGNNLLAIDGSSYMVDDRFKRYLVDELIGKQTKSKHDSRD